MQNVSVICSLIIQMQLSTIKEDIMEDRILVDINPFALHQKINVVKNDNISTFSTISADLPNMVCNLAKQYGIENIDLKGNIIGIDLSELNKLSNLKMLSLKEINE